MSSTILIATFNRNNLLRYNLISLLKQNPNAEIIVLDDCFQSDLNCQKLISEFPSIRYIHSGSTKTDNYWRTPGFAFNIGAKQSDSSFIFLCCAEIFHYNATFNIMLEQLKAHKQKSMIIPKGKTDSSRHITNLLNRNQEILDNHFNKLPILKTQYPFFMGLSRADFFEIGGYDEDFTGIAMEDRDLVERLQQHGCEYIHTNAKIIHLHHSRARNNIGLSEQNTNKRKEYNKHIYEEKKGQIIRNQNREWGML